jgi:predicted nucleic-acid-binding Zn-ribbon protein
MSIKPNLILIECSQCHWSQVYSQNSDALLKSLWPDTCPKCGNQPLEYSSAGMMDL